MDIFSAYAQGASSPSGGGGDPFMSLLVPMLLMAAIFYFLIILPQQKRSKRHREMITNIRRGDTVVSSCGFIGKVTRVPENLDELEVEFSDEMKIRIAKSTLLEVRSKNEPVRS